MLVLIIDDLPEEIPERLQSFLIQRPGRTQARVMQNALSLFLLQNGVNDQPSLSCIWSRCFQSVNLRKEA